MAAPCLLPLLLLGGRGSIAQQTKKQSQPPFVTLNQKGFDVSVSLSENARKLLADGKETIIVAAYLTGSPKANTPRHYVSDMGEVGLGNLDVEVAPGQIAHVGEIKAKQDALAQIDEHGPQLLINVFSGRKSSQNNLLSCDVYEGPLSKVEGGTIPIFCKLIRGD